MTPKQRFAVIEGLWNEKTRDLHTAAGKATVSRLRHQVDAEVWTHRVERLEEQVTALAQVLDILRGLAG